MVVQLRNIEAYLEDTRLPSALGYLPPLELSPINGIVPQSLNLGYPEVRDNVTRRPAANGTYDRTAYYGSKAVSMVLKYDGNMIGIPDQDIEDKIRSWMNPSVRAYLYYRFSSTANWRRVLVRPSNLNRSVNLIRNEFGMVSLTFRAPLGINESSEEFILSVDAAASSELGRTYPLTFDRTYPTSTIAGSVPVVNEGNAPWFPVITFSGACTQPRIENVTTNKRIVFQNTFSLLAGQTLMIDFAEGTVLLDGNPANSRYSKIDFSSSSWFDLQPGENLLRFYPAASTAPCFAEIKYRHGYL